MDDDRNSGGGKNGDDEGGGDLELGASGAVSVAEGAGPRDPSEIRDPLPQPLLSWRRLAMVALLAVAVGCIVVAARSGGGSEDVSSDEAIVTYLPTPGGRVQRQSPVGVELQAGYDGRLTINEVAIPEEQMVGAIVPGSEAADAQTDEERQLGPRPNNKQLVMFQPGEGKAITEYDTGSVEISVRLWKVSDGPQTARTVTYAINVF